MTSSGPGRWFPLLADLAGSRRDALAQDALAGTITAVLLVPQSLAYAVLAGLPPAAGLYASIVAPIAYALTGTSRTLSVGPVAVAAVMVAAALAPFAGADPERAVAGAILLSAMSGVLLAAMGLLRLGWLAHFISHPVLDGFVTGSAIFIVATQAGPLTGIALPRDAGLAQIVTGFVGGLPDLQPWSLAFGAGAIILLVLARTPLQALLVRTGRPPATAAMMVRAAPLLILVAAIVLSHGLDAQGRLGVATIGDIPRGLPAFGLAFLHEPGWTTLIPSAALIGVINYVSSISVAKALAFRRRERIDPDRELIALGVANLAAACSGAMPVAGGLARSTVNIDAGARTQLAAIVSSLWVAVIALFFTGLLRDLPRAVLAALIVVAVWQLIELRDIRNTWRYDRGDGTARLLTIVGVLALGVESGLLLGVALSTALFLYRTSRPHIAVVGRVPHTEHYRNVNRHQVDTWPHLVLVRIDENLYFANASRIESELHRIVLEHPSAAEVVLILSGTAYIDASALEMLESFEDGLRQNGVRLRLAEVKGPVMDRLQGMPLLAQVGEDRIHLTTQQAVEAAGIGGA